MSWIHQREDNTLPRDYFVWQLERPKPALPSSYFWTWDHSTNWVLDDPGLQNQGCGNRYLKQPETFVEDYRRLTDLAAGLGVRGIIIWGFLRDSHGGEEYAKQVAAYAKSKGVAIMPGIGNSWYGSTYYESLAGDHPYCMPYFTRQHPEARMLNEDGSPAAFNNDFGASPAHPAYQEWMAEQLHWLFREFEIDGLNLENGDMVMDFHPLTRAARQQWPADDAEEFFFQALCYKPSLEAVAEKLAQSLVTYCTYTGFQYTDAVALNEGMGKHRPVMFDVLPEQGIAQWTLTGMLLKQPLPLTAYLDEGAPAAAFENPDWPADLCPPSKRSTGYFHQGSQWAYKWSNLGRYDCMVSTIKEACLRAYRAGLEGVSITGEVTSRCIPNAINYLAFSHFIHWPEDTLRDFGRKTLSQVLGSERDGEEFAVILANWDGGTLTEELKQLANPEKHGFIPSPVCDYAGKNAQEYQRYQFWQWLNTVVNTTAPPRPIVYPTGHIAVNSDNSGRFESILPF